MSDNTTTSTDVPSLTDADFVGPQRAEKLREAGVTHLSQAADMNASELSDRADLGSSSARTVVRQARATVPDDPDSADLDTDERMDVLTDVSRLDIRASVAEKLHRAGVSTAHDLANISDDQISEWALGVQSQVADARNTAQEALGVDSHLPMALHRHKEESESVAVVTVPDDQDPDAVSGRIQDAISKFFDINGWIPSVVACLTQDDHVDQVTEWGLEQNRHTSPGEEIDVVEVDGVFERVGYDEDPPSEVWKAFFQVRDRRLAELVDGVILTGMSADVGSMYNMAQDIDLDWACIFDDEADDSEGSDDSDSDSEEVDVSDDDDIDPVDDELPDLENEKSPAEESAFVFDNA